LTVLALHAGAGASTPAEIAGAVDGVYASEEYQTELPPPAAPQLPRAPWELPDAVKTILKIVFYTLLVVGGLLLLFYLANALPSLQAALRRRGEGPQAAVDAPATDADRERLDVALAEADRLARQSDYGAALHLLLLYCLGELRRRFGLHWPSALTSREILRAATLPEARRSGLSVIVSAVEVSHFGGRSVDEATYRQCRERCEDVVFGGVAA
jgi:hypothetical protein